MSLDSSVLVERRGAILRLGLIAMVGWGVLRLAWPALGAASHLTFPFWAGLTLLYAADRRARFRLLYESMLGATAYFLLHDVPMHLHLHALEPGTMGGFFALLLATGALAALPFGRRGPAVAAGAAALLGGLWMLYHFEYTGFALALGLAKDCVLRPISFMLLGGLSCEWLTRRVRGDLAAPGANGALWGFVVGATLAQLLAL